MVKYYQFHHKFNDDTSWSEEHFILNVLLNDIIINSHNPFQQMDGRRKMQMNKMFDGNAHGLLKQQN